MDKKEITSFIEQEAKTIGFDLVGFAPATALDEEHDKYVQWLERGFHGEMKWMEREPEKRSDPRVLFPGTKSVVSLAVNYYTPHEQPTDPTIGKMSRYAWGDDYHDVIKKMLWALLDRIHEKAPEIEGKVCVDTAPIMDKVWAEKAGLGWIGKHTNLITQELGSWVFLAEVLLNVELEYAQDASEDHCGSCTMCIDACPTDAIVEPYLVDSNRCISYATIELRSAVLPQNVSDNLEGWLYGCDICQDVCPWNRFEKDSNNTAFEPRLQNTSAKLEAIASMSHEEYVERFRKSAIKRTKLTGLVRNANALLNSERFQTMEKNDVESE